MELDAGQDSNLNTDQHIDNNYNLNQNNEEEIKEHHEQLNTN
jgi:hypothetical protein